MALDDIGKADEAVKTFLRLTLRMKRFGLILIVLLIASGAVLWRRIIRSRLSNPVAVPGQQFVYVCNIESNAISQYRMSTDGTLTPLEPPTVEDDKGPSGAFVVQKRFLFVLDNTNGASLSRYRIGSDGALHPLSRIVFSAWDEAVNALEEKEGNGQSLATDDLRNANIQGDALPTLVGIVPPEDGHCFYAAKSDGSICRYAVTTGGDLRLVSRVSVLDPPPTEKGAMVPLFVDAKRNWLYFGYNSTLGQVRLRADGSLTGSVFIAPGGSYPDGRPYYYQSIVASPDGGLLCADRLHGAGYSDLLWLKLKPNGRLPRVPNVRDRTQPSGLGSTVISPDGRDIYIPGSSGPACGGNVVTHYRLRPDDGLARARMPYIGAGMYPIGLTFDKTARFAYVLDERIDESVGRPKDNGRLWQYRCNPDGSLTALSPAFVPVGKVPVSMAVARL